MGLGFVARDSELPLIAAMTFAPAAPGRFAPLAIGITVLGTAVADPCVPGEPLMQTAACGTDGTAKEDRRVADKAE